MSQVLTAGQMFLAGIGRAVLGLCRSTGALVLFALQAVAGILVPPFYGIEFLRQMMRIGYFSLPVVGLTALFTGGALALQIYAGGSRFNAESAVPSIVAIGMVRELGPVLCGLMVAGRVGASIAAEIGSMRVTEQIDALTTLSTNPIKFLVAPRVLAGTLAMPLLTAVSDIIGVMGGFFVGTSRLGIASGNYIQNTLDYLTAGDVVSSLVKGAVFGFIIAVVGCFEGYNSGRGAQGVAQATRAAVVTSSILILAANYLLTEVFFST
ncbi:ABC transporter permease [Oceanicella sp. SM1341]|uniref:MlaE family ABC transporter permease n=1 Tax=Oceanicella sp. SM1341 TaxID=1548889 RepID=UPI000E4D7928|nr:ABC transporter permease [Oceanicella sp. SM1341]